MPHPNEHRSSSGLIQRYIGTAYDNIKALAFYLPELLELLEFFRASQGAVDKNVEYTQATPANIWVIEHNMDKHPSVHTEDTSGNDVKGEIDYVSDDIVHVIFSSPISGTATLN